MTRRSGLALGLLAGPALDVVLADPRDGHPVAVFGKAASRAEQRLWADSRLAGAAFTGACLAGVLALGVAAERVSRRGHVLTAAATATAVWVVLGGTSLAAEASALAAALEAGDVAAARRRLPSLCGRDPASLGAAELARAAVESVAENTCDAVVAPLLWGAVCGLPGLLGYRAVNTLDAMVGHRNARYERFGWASARLDDLVNWAPARATAVLACSLAPLVGGSPRQSWRVLRRDGAAHPSPNAGRCEAAFAGALKVRLGGVNVYDGEAEERGTLGDGPPPTASHIRRAVRLSRAVTAAAAGLSAAAAWAAHGGTR